MQNQLVSHDNTDSDTLIEEINQLIKKNATPYFQVPSFKMNDFLIAQYKSTFKIYQDLVNMTVDDPLNLIKVQNSFWQDYMELSRKNTMYWLGMSTEILTNNDKKDKQFNDETWNENPFFSFLKQYYELVKKHAQEIVIQSDEKSAKKVRFYINQMMDALSPNNFFITNPEVLRAISKTDGMCLLDGLKNMLQDLYRGSGQLAMSMTDFAAFEVGKNLAITPGKVIYQNDLMQLIQYNPATSHVYAKPVLIIPPWINKYYILDLSEKNSFVKWLVNAGYTVFMISWVNPNAQHANKDFQDYMLEGPIDALNIIEKVTGQKKINALGFCIGGTLLACTLAYMAQIKDTRIKSATYLTTLLDFTNPGDLGVFIDEEQLRALEQHTSQQGYLSGYSMMTTFSLLRANELVWSYFKKNYLQGEKPTAIDFLYWNSDPTNLPAKMINTYLREMYYDNRLKEAGGISLNHIPIDLQRIKVPIYF